MPQPNLSEQPILLEDPVTLRISCFTLKRDSTAAFLQSTEIVLRSPEAVDALTRVVCMVNRFLVEHDPAIAVRLDTVRTRKQKALATVCRLEAGQIPGSSTVSRLRELDDLKAFIRSAPDQPV